MGSGLARRRFALFGLAAVLGALLVSSATTAGAIVGGQPTGAQYSNVGLLWIHSGLDIWSCSGTLISPTVVVTAAHCTGGEYAVDRVDVTFAAVATDAAGELTSPSIPGTPHFDPRYLAAVKNGGEKAFVAQKAFDRGVVVLSRPAADVFPGITPALLPTVGVLDAYATAGKAKNSQALVSVGYGVTREPHTNPNQILYDGVRRMATGPLAALDSEVLWIRGNPNSSWGNGGTCFGDSGGPNFLGTTIVSVSTFVKSPCQNLDGNTRLDTNAARDFLSRYPVAFPN